MCVLKCVKYKLKSNIIIKILILMAYLIHKYMFGNKKENPLIVRISERLHLGWHTYVFLFCFSIQEREMLQVRHPTSFVPNSLSIPFPEDRRQVLLDRHLLSVAAVAVCEDPIRVALGEGLRAVLQGLPTAVCETNRRHHGFT